MILQNPIFGFQFCEDERNCDDEHLTRDFDQSFDDYSDEHGTTFNGKILFIH